MFLLRRNAISRRARKSRVSQGRWRPYLFSFGFLETCCHSSRPDFVGIQIRCEACCYLCSSAVIIPVLRNSPHSYKISVLSWRMKTALLMSFRFYITYTQQVFIKRSSPKIMEWSHLMPTQNRGKSRGLHYLSVRHYRLICMPQLKWPMRITFSITNRWMCFHWSRARNYPETRNVHCFRIDFQQWIILLPFKLCFSFRHQRCSRDRFSVNYGLFECEIHTNWEVHILFQCVDIDSFSRLG
jgi:hypothetical protein